MNLHTVLDQHDTIAWDFDLTLWNGPNSEWFCRYIQLTPHKKHYIVTFRTADEARMIQYLFMKQAGMNHIGNPLSLFVDVIVCPNEYRDCHGFRSGHFDKESEKLFRQIYAHLTDEDIDAHAASMLAFKSLMAKKHGCTILVDDLPEMVEDGCLAQGVAFLHAHEPVGMTVRAMAPRRF